MRRTRGEKPLTQPHEYRRRESKNPADIAVTLRTHQTPAIRSECPGRPGGVLVDPYGNRPSATGPCLRLVHDGSSTVTLIDEYHADRFSMSASVSIFATTLICGL